MLAGFPNVAWTAPVPWVDVLESLGTVTAVIVALWFGVHELIAGRRERRARDEVAREQQARRVSLYQTLEQTPQGWERRNVIKNASEMAIHQTMLTNPHQGVEPDGTRLETSVFVQAVAPGETWRSDPLTTSLDLGAGYITFRDHLGQHWKLDLNGTLEAREA